MNLIEQVLKLDAEATKGPWGANTWVNNDDGGWAAVGPHHEPQDGDDPDDLHNPGEPGSDCHERAEVDARLLSLYRTAAPKLARALKKAFDLLRSYRDRRTEFERITGESDHTVDRCEHAMNICRQQRVDKILAEIEKELAP